VKLAIKDDKRYAMKILKKSKLKRKKDFTKDMDGSIIYLTKFFIDVIIKDAL
jgi:hypothetical protein